MKAPRRLSDDPDFARETGLDLSDPNVGLAEHDLPQLKADVLAQAATLSPLSQVWSALTQGAGPWAMLAVAGGAVALALAWPSADTPTREAPPTAPAHAPAPEPAPTQAPAPDHAEAFASLNAPQDAHLNAHHADAHAARLAARVVDTASVAADRRRRFVSRAAALGRPQRRPPRSAPKPKPPESAAALPERAAAPAEPSAPPEPPPKPSLAEQLALYDQGATALRRGRWADAVARFDVYLTRYPQGQLRREARLSRLEALVRLGRNGRALREAEAMRDAPAFRGRRGQLQGLCVELYVKLGRCARARDALAQADALAWPEARRAAVLRRCAQPPSPKTPKERP